MKYRASQSNGEYDFDLLYPDGQASAVEVTSSVDQTLEETHEAIIDKPKGGSDIPIRLCKNSWYIHLLSDTRISQVRKNADRYLSAIETAGIEKFWGPTDDHPSVEGIYRDLGVMTGSVAPWITPRIKMSLPGTGGGVDATTVIDAAEREAFKPDNRKKLGIATSRERHGRLRLPNHAGLGSAFRLRSAGGSAELAVRDHGHLDIQRELRRGRVRCLAVQFFPSVDETKTCAQHVKQILLPPVVEKPLLPDGVFVDLRSRSAGTR